MGRIVRQLVANQGASMGPQLYRCGNSRARYVTTAPPARFNGAATLSLRKLSTGRAGSAPAAACFNGAATLSLRKCEKLTAVAPPPLIHASMGPQLYRCGNEEYAVVRAEAVIASMGPQLYRCGNQTNAQFNLLHTYLLQWGRNFIVAEIGICLGGLYPCRRASMGPQLYRCGNSGCHGPRLWPPCPCFNGAATLSLRKCMVFR